MNPCEIMGIMRRLLGVTLLLLAFVVPTTTPAQAVTAPFPYVLSIQGAYGTATVTVPVPAETSPVRFTGRIQSSFTRPGQFLISINGQIRERVPTTGGRFRVPLRRSDVVDSAVRISLSVQLRPSRNCLIDDRSQATIRNPRLVLNRKPGKPQTIADFISPATRSFLVTVPTAATPDEQAAGLDTVLALRHTVGPPTRIRLRATDNPPSTTPRRSVVVVDEDGSGSSALSVRQGRLFVTGSPGEVTKAAISIADPNASLLDVRTVTNLSGTADYSPVDPQTTLSDLGIPELSVVGIGSVSTTVSIPQAAFGQPVQQLILNLRGAATPVRKGQEGRINIRWNNELVSSRLLTDNSRVALDLTIGAGNLFSVNYLTAELEYIPGGRNCQQPLPGELAFDTSASAVSATLGDSTPPGFQRFPQSFPAVIPVGFGADPSPALENAARILDAAASVSPLQYTVEILDEPTRRPGALIAGATLTQAQDLGAPLPDQQNLANFPPGRSTPYAALQAYFSNGDDLIVLNGEPASAARSLANWPAAQDGGWAGMQGQVYVKSRSSEEPQSFDVPSTAPDRQRPQLIAAGVLTVALLIGLVIWLRWRFARR